ncbi:hypothetical protein [Actinocorallia libanotica]|uniref:Uncharacterized protein n=1 Tax=Actinocorallia libanotica TaxID=46162 RepID=A0ABN1S344_9ACTN
MQIRNPETLQRLVDSAAQQQRKAEEAGAAANGYAEQIVQLQAALDQVQSSHASASADARNAADLAHDYSEIVRAVCEANGWTVPEPAAPPAPRSVEQEAREAVDRNKSKRAEAEATQAVPVAAR